ncbi:hypothetical protein F511_42777 [Dorcoceras hygrometricum]|uniref:Uncharacterized protein n=1 Tax=Dorcoceras hygrometricum TaxID=472368 RepID=A0A2Z7B5K2_9LAMI|nr:hypothetical protein F511_42777 [Dorcoceras hygrometricum]
MFTSATSVPFKGNNNVYVSNKCSVQREQQCLRQQQAFRSKGRSMFTSAASSSVQREQTCLHHPYMLDSNAYISITDGRHLSFAGVFELPTEGLSDFSDVPKNLVYDARNIFSKSGEPVVPHGKKNLLKYEYRLLNDILEKSITVKVGSFDAVTNERFQMMTAIHFGLKVNESDSDRVHGTVDTVDVEQLFETANVEEAEGSISPVVEKDIAKVVGNKHSAEEIMSIDDLLLQIPDDMLLPSVTAAEITKIRLGESISINEVQERDLYYASLPRISTLDKGKEILEEDEPVKGNPTRETVELICGDVEFLVQLCDRVMKDVVEFFHSFSLNKLSNLDALLELKAKEKLMLEWAETDSLETAVKRKVYILAKYREMLLRKFVVSHRKYYTPGHPWTATASKIIDLLSVAHSKSLEDLIAQQKEHGLPVEQPCTSTFLDASVGSGAVLAQFYSMAKSTCWTSLPIGCTEFVEAINDLRTLLIQRINDSNGEILSKLNTVDRGVLDALRQQHETLRHSLQGIRQDNQRQGDSQLLHIDHFKKGVAAHGLNFIENFVDVKKELSAQDAKITALDGQIAAIRSEQLEFQAKIAADLLSLSTQLGDIVDYIRGSDAKKGEGSSSRRPLPTPVNQGETSGNVVRTTEISQRFIDNAQRDIVERMMTADRERERSRRSRSGSYKRRRF